MSNDSSFALRITSTDRNQLVVARNYLSTTPWPWDLGEVERCLAPGKGFRFRAHVRGPETTSSKWISGDYGLLAEVLELFPSVRIDGIFRDGYGYGSLDGTDKDYEHQYPKESSEDEDADEVEGGDVFERDLVPPGLLLITSDTPLAESDKDFNRRLEVVAEILRDLGAKDLGCSIVDDGTMEWTVSAQMETLTPEQSLWLCHELRRIRLPLDARLCRSSNEALGIWPVSNRPWRSFF